MQGLFINGQRPKSKKAVKEAIASDPRSVRFEATSLFGGDYDGTADKMPYGKIPFVGPNPHTDRKFYGTIINQGGKLKVS